MRPARVANTQDRPHMKGPRPAGLLASRRMSFQKSDFEADILNHLRSLASVKLLLMPRRRLTLQLDTDITKLCKEYTA